jgi:hypothetical protein
MNSNFSPITTAIRHAFCSATAGKGQKPSLIAVQGGEFSQSYFLEPLISAQVN